MTQPSLIVYGADWCGDCRRSKKFLNEQNIPFTWVNTDDDKEAEALVIRLNNGSRSIPTILFEDGTVLVEPSNEELANKLGIAV